MARYAFMLSLVFLYSGCCTKKKCIGDRLPFIAVTFNGIPASASYDKVNVYTYVNNVLTDSAFYTKGDQDQISFTLFPFEASENTDKHYRLSWNGKTETITGISCEFFEKKIKCNTCFLVLGAKETVTDTRNFQFTAKGQNFHDVDSLSLQW